MNQSTTVTDYQPYAGDHDSFLPLFLIVAILLTVMLNFMLLATLLKYRSLSGCDFVQMMCCLDLFAGFIVLPLALAAATDYHILGNPTLCIVAGFLTTFCNRASTFNVCAMTVERYYFIAQPMKYDHTMPRRLRNFAIGVSITLALVVSAAPLIASPWIDGDTYMPMTYVPMCVLVPNTLTSVVLVRLDATLSFFIPLAIIFVSSIGMLKIACKLFAEDKAKAGQLRGKDIGNQGGVHKPKFIPAVSLHPPSVAWVRRSVRDMPRASFRKRSRDSGPVSSSPGNFKAFATIATTLCIFSLLNIPMASLLLVISLRDPHTGTSSQIPALEYISCVGTLATYMVYPILHGLVNREIRVKLLQMVRRSFRLYHFDIGDDDVTPWECEVEYVRKSNIKVEVAEEDVTKIGVDEAGDTVHSITSFTEKTTAVIVERKVVSRTGKRSANASPTYPREATSVSSYSFECNEQSTSTSKVIKSLPLGRRTDNSNSSPNLTRKLSIDDVPLGTLKNNLLMQLVKQQGRRRSRSEEIYIYDNPLMYSPHMSKQRRLYNMQRSNLGASASASDATCLPGSPTD